MTRFNWLNLLIIVTALLPVFVINAEVKKKTITNELEKQQFPKKGAVTDIYLKPDLTVSISNCPNRLYATDSIIAGCVPASVNVEVSSVNKKIGKVKVLEKEVKVLEQMVLQGSAVCKYPIKSASYSDKYFDGVLIKGGTDRVKIKTGQRINIERRDCEEIPREIDSGKYYLCAYIDTNNDLDESNERNNCDCCAIEISGVIYIDPSFENDENSPGYHEY